MEKNSDRIKNKLRELLPYFLMACALVVFAILAYERLHGSVFHGISGFFRVMRPVIIGLVIVFFIAPIVSSLEKQFFRLQAYLRRQTKLPLPKKFRQSTKPHKGLIRLLAMFISYVLFIGLIVLAVAYVIPQLINSLSVILNLVADSASVLIERIRRFSERYDSIPLASFVNMDDLTEIVNSQVGNLTTTLQRIISSLVPQIYALVLQLVNGLLNLVIGIIISIYLVADRERMLHMLKKIIYAIFNKAHSMLIMNMAAETAEIFKVFFLGKIIDSLLIGILCYIAMLILRLDYPLLIGTIVGVTNVIPYFGPWIGAIPSGLILLMESPLQAFIFAIMVLVLQQFDGNILGPYILGGSLGIKPFWIIFSVTIGGGLFGVLGMLFGVPVFTAIYTMVRRYLNYRLEKKGIQDGDLETLEAERRQFTHPITTPTADDPTQKKSRFSFKRKSK